MTDKLADQLKASSELYNKGLRAGTRQERARVVRFGWRWAREQRANDRSVRAVAVEEFLDALNKGKE